MTTHTIESVALGLLDEIKEEPKRLQAQIGLQRICILGNHDQYAAQMEEIARRLCSENYPATIMKKIPDSKEMPMADFHKEISILKKSKVIVVIDSPKGGVVNECTYLMQNPELISGTILMIPTTTPDTTCYSVTNHYVYFPTKIKYDEDTLVEVAILATKQTSHRLAMIELMIK